MSDDNMSKEEARLMRALAKKGGSAAGLGKKVASTPAWKLEQQRKEKEAAEKQKAEAEARAAQKEQEKIENSRRMEEIRNAQAEAEEAQAKAPRVTADDEHSGVVTTSPLADNAGIKVAVGGDDTVLCKGAVGAREEEESLRLEEKRLDRSFKRNIDEEAEAKRLAAIEEKEKRKKEAELKLRRKKRESIKVVQQREAKEKAEKEALEKSAAAEKKAAAADFLGTLLAPKKM